MIAVRKCAVWAHDPATACRRAGKSAGVSSRGPQLPSAVDSAQNQPGAGAMERCMGETNDITLLLEQARNGERAAWDRAVALVYADLRRLAHRQLAGRNRGDQTLDTTGLVHECYLRLAGADKSVNDRGHFFALASRVMRQVICDYARERMAQKRGAGERGIPLEEIEVAESRQAMQLIELDDLLTRLMQENERQARVVECRFFAGLTEAETAQALGISERSVQRDWSDARTWLSTQV